MYTTQAFRGRPPRLVRAATSRSRARTAGPAAACSPSWPPTGRCRPRSGPERAALRPARRRARLHRRSRRTARTCRPRRFEAVRLRRTPATVGTLTCLHPAAEAGASPPCPGPHPGVTVKTLRAPSAGPVPASVHHRHQGPSRMSRVVLHLGLPKTGTSFLQSVLRENESRAARPRRAPAGRPVRTSSPRCSTSPTAPTSWGRSAEAGRRAWKRVLADPDSGTAAPR